MVGFGFVGTGVIARKLKLAVERSDRAALEAVVSRDLSRAQAFSAPHSYDNLQDMLRCPQVDVVYIATPHPMHFEEAKMCLLAGKAVLCEKPFASNLEQVKQMVAKAQEKQVFLMEAL